MSLSFDTVSVGFFSPSVCEVLSHFCVILRPGINASYVDHNITNNVHCLPTVLKTCKPRKLLTAKQRENKRKAWILNRGISCVFNIC